MRGEVNLWWVATWMAEDISAFHRPTMKRRKSNASVATLKRTGSSAAARLTNSLPNYSAELLVSALEDLAIERRHTAIQLAIAIGIHPAHWYRLRASPGLLARCERPTLESIAFYLGWPTGRVLLACGVVSRLDFEVVLGGQEVVEQAIAQIERGAMGAGLITPLDRAAPDHRILLAELFLLLQAEKLKGEKSATAGYVGKGE